MGRLHLSRLESLAAHQIEPLQRLDVRTDIPSCKYFSDVFSAVLLPVEMGVILCMFFFLFTFDCYCFGFDFVPSFPLC